MPTAIFEDDDLLKAIARECGLDMSATEVKNKKIEDGVLKVFWRVKK